MEGAAIDSTVVEGQLVQPRKRQRRKPWLAAILSLLAPGLGQYYCGYFCKGAVFFAFALFAPGASLWTPLALRIEGALIYC